MGALTSRQHAGVEEADVVSNHAYKYPPRSGNFFGTHFIMGGERFDTPQPEAYLFGENADLNFLGSKPTPFPYPPPQSNEPTKTLKSLVNIRKESLRFVRCPEPVGKLSDSNNKIGDGAMKSADSNGKGTYYNIEFTFDCDVRCAITIFYFCTEEITPTGVVHYPRDPTMNSQTYHYKKGANQQFCQISHVFDPSKHAEEDLVYNADREIIPIAIYCVVDEGQEEIRQSHTTIAVVERHSDGTYVLKALKQKLFVDGLCYLLQEIYGIENKNLDTKPSSDEETEDGGSECVICMCDVRDTLILPCRHLCLCNSCADSLRYQANNCPICRAPFRALLQIRALQRRAPPAGPAPSHHTPDVPVPSGKRPPIIVLEGTSTVSGETWMIHIYNCRQGSMENIPPGYEPVSLIEALNGPHAPSSAPKLHPAIASPDTDTASQQAAEILNRCGLDRGSCSSLTSAGRRARAERDDLKTNRPPRTLTPEFRMSVLLAREEQAKLAEEKTAADSPLLYNHKPNHVTKSTLSLNLPSETCRRSLEASCSSEDVARGRDSRDLRESRDSRDSRDLHDSPEEESAQMDARVETHEAELDSETERMSPLLTHQLNGVLKHASSLSLSPETLKPEVDVDIVADSALRLATPHLAHIDDTDTDEPDNRDSISRADAESCTGEDSDYFTPEDGAATILTHPKQIKHPEATTNGECTPQRWALPHHVTSLPGMPGTPLSQASVRSSGDSYSSSSSTRQLLARAPRPAC